MNPTLIGAFAVLVWGISLPVAKIIEQQIGSASFIGILFFCTGTLSLIKSYSKDFKLSSISLKNADPVKLSLRWIFFVLHEGCILSAVGIVSAKNLPIVILINYLWPTAIILFSILIADVKITKPKFFVLGTLIVILSLAFEMLSGTTIDDSIFNLFTDKIAYIISFIAAVSWGLYCAITRKYAEVTKQGLPVPYFQLTLGLIYFLSFIPSFSHPWQLTDNGAIILVSMCFAQFVAYLSWDYGTRKGNIVVLSLIADFIPWVSLLSSALFLDIQIHLSTIFTAIFLVIGAMLTRYATLNNKVID